MADGAGANFKCPQCAHETRISLTANPFPDQTVKYRVYPNLGSFMSAKSIGGQMEAIADLLEGEWVEPDWKRKAMLANIVMHEEDGSIEFTLMLVGVDKRESELAGDEMEEKP